MDFKRRKWRWVVSLLFTTSSSSSILLVVEVVVVVVGQLGRLSLSLLSPTCSHSESNVPSPPVRVKGILVVNPEDEKGGNVGDCFKWTALPASATVGGQRGIVRS